MTDQIAVQDIEQALQEQINQAVATGSVLQIVGAGSKQFYGRQIDAQALDVSGHSGVIDYDPTELVITVRGGCRIVDVQALLAQHNQMLGFEPPVYADGATIGGMVAAGLCGPRRAFSGAVRDFILGLKLLNGRGEVNNFGGRVIKNVAGFDVSRLMAGAMGTLGVMLEVTLRVVPSYESEITLGFEHPREQAHIDWINQLGTKPYPLSASAWHGGQSFIRLSGSTQGVTSAASQLGGDTVDEPWSQLAVQDHEFFSGSSPVCRISVPPACAAFLSKREQLIEWGGAQRWIRGDDDIVSVREKVEKLSGTLCVFRGKVPGVEPFHPLNETMLKLHRSLKSSFDPAGILNPGRMYEGL